MKNRNQNVLGVVTGSLVLFTLGAIYLASVAYRALPYRHLSQESVSSLFVSDPRLGHVPLPNAEGFLRFPGGDLAIPTHHDDEGLRVPAGTRHGFTGARHPRLLFLGDSFTYGDLTLAEDTFAYKAAVKLGGESINGGVNGYGLAGMVLRARQLIPKYKPDYVIVQYSPWLVSRAMSEFAPTYYPVHSPVPYYASGSRPTIVAPPFARSAIDLPAREYGTVEFLWRLALPVLARDDFNMAAFRVKQLLGMRKWPSRDAGEIVRSAYGEMATLAQANGGRPIILVLGEDAAPFDVPGDLFPAGTYGIDSRVALLEQLPEPGNEAYMRNYWHWAGHPAVPANPHPNERAHEIIAGVVAEGVRRLEGARQ